jgi:uncharacterized protein (TIGR00299 family) protein
MKTIAYLDCATGISGDMCLGALLDAGVPLDYLQTQLAALGLKDEFILQAGPVARQGLRALKAEVVLTDSVAVANSHGHSHPHGDHNSGHSHHSHSPHQGGGIATTAGRNLSAITELIAAASLPARVSQWSLAIFRRLAEAEAAVHGIPIEQVHFHEVGATDAIVDIVGTCLGLDWLQVDALYCSPLPTGSGRVKAAHGWLPVPAPAVLKLLELGQVPIYSNGIAGELVTPTGAAIVTTLAEQFGAPPPMILQSTGLGAGTKDLPVANMLRLWLGQASDGSTSENVMRLNQPALEQGLIQSLPAPPEQPPLETVVVLETQVDDMVPQAMGFLFEQLFKAGALDVFTQSVGMKKSRPGLLITTICTPETVSACERVLFEETPTLGIRRQQQQRRTLDRCFQPLETPYGNIAMKLAYHPQTGELLNVHPEYEDCVALALAHRVPWQRVYHSALSCWFSRHPISEVKHQK